MLYLFERKALCIILSCVFITFFEISIGPIMWLYIPEIMTPLGAGIAFSLNWIFVIVFAVISTLLFENQQRNTYLGLSINCCIGIFFILHFVRETKGLSHYKCRKLYFPNPQFKNIDSSQEEDSCTEDKIKLEVREDNTPSRLFEDSTIVHRPKSRKNQKVNSTYEEETKYAFMYSEKSAPNLS